jgi:orotidine-5'-phosphate decarboxylase
VVNRVIVALDVSAIDEATALARPLVDEVGGFKVGMELLMAAGPRAIETIAQLGNPVFVDAKLHDIPNTVERAAARIRDAGARWVTVHAAGGEEMIRAGVSGMGDKGVLGVTMLTSLTQADLGSVGIPGESTDYVVAMARLAAIAGVEGIVCSPAEIRAVKTDRPEVSVFTPGVRPAASTVDDQRRVATPEQARSDGADFLVIGRPITRADDPVEAVRKIVASIALFD